MSKRSMIIGVPVTRSEHRRVRAVARASGMTMAGVVRLCAGPLFSEGEWDRENWVAFMRMLRELDLNFAGPVDSEAPAPEAPSR